MTELYDSFLWLIHSDSFEQENIGYIMERVDTTGCGTELIGRKTLKDWP